MKWRSQTLGEIVAENRGLVQTGPFGSQLHQSDYTPDGIPVIMPTDITDGRISAERIAHVPEETANRLSRHKLKPRTIVLPRRGEITKRAFIRDEQEGWLCGSGCLKIEVQDTELLPEFLYYYMEQHKAVQWLEQHAVGSTMLNLSAGIVNQFPVHYPNQSTQARIATILSTYDDAIENNRRRMGLLEKAARLLYEEWFVRLRFPGHEHTPVKNGLPQGWAKCHIGNFIEQGKVDIQTGPFGTQLKASDYTEEGTPVINVRNIGYGDLRPDKLEYVPEDVADRLSVHLLREGDIVFGRKGAVDRHILISSSQDGWMQGSDCIRLRAKSEEVCPVLLSFAFREPSHHQWMLTQCGNKATMPSLNQGVISRIPAIVPPTIILAEFRSFAVDCLNQITNLKTQNQKLRAARDLLLPRLMSGEIEV